MSLHKLKLVSDERLIEILERYTATGDEFLTAEDMVRLCNALIIDNQLLSQYSADMYAIAKANAQYWNCVAEFEGLGYCAEYATAAENITHDLLKKWATEEAN